MPTDSSLRSAGFNICPHGHNDDQTVHMPDGSAPLVSDSEVSLSIPCSRARRDGEPLRMNAVDEGQRGSLRRRRRREILSRRQILFRNRKATLVVLLKVVLNKCSSVRLSLV